MSLEARYYRERQQNESSGGSAWGPLTAAGAFLASLFAANLAWNHNQDAIRNAQEAEHAEYCSTILNESRRDILGCPE